MLGIALDHFNQFKPFHVDLRNVQDGQKVAVQTEPRSRLFAPVDAFSKVQQVLDQRLSETLGTQKAVPVMATNSSFDAETVAGNVLAFVQNRMKQAEMDGASPAELESLLEQAKSAVQQGVEEAKEALEGMGLLTETVKSGIEQTQELVNKGLEPAEEAELSTTGAQLIDASHRFRQIEKSNFELQVKTQDGDLVTLEFKQQNRQQGSLSIHQQGGVTDLSSRYAESSHSRFSLSVEGDLDESELMAISDLAQGIQKVSEGFFDGNVQAAFEQGMSLGYNTDEIAGFSLEMSHSLSSIATTKYREIGTLDTKESPKLTGLGGVRDLLDQLSGVMEQANKLFEDVDQAMSGMMNGFLSQHPKADNFSDMLNRSGEEELEEVAEKMLEKAKHHHHHEHDDD